MNTTYNLTLTTAEARILKDFLHKHAPKHPDPSTISDDERAIAFIYDRLPDVTLGQQTFTNEQTSTTPQQELFRLCYDIIRTAPSQK